MEESIPNKSADFPTAFRQSLLSASVLTLMVVALIASQVAIRHDHSLLPSRLNVWKNQDEQIFDPGYFPTGDLRFIYQDLPAADYSEEGFYLFGTSVTRFDLMPWNYPAFVHDYCVVGGNHTVTGQFIQHLIRHAQFLEAAEWKTSITVELSFPNAQHQFDDPSISPAGPVWPSFFTRYGIYKYDPRTGLDFAPMSPVRREFAFIGIQTNAFWHWVCLKLTGEAAMNRLFVVPVDRTRSKVEQHDTAASRAEWMKRLGPSWEAGMDAEFRQLTELLDSLHDHHVNVTAVYMPVATWCDGWPVETRYREKAMALCASKNVPVLDLRRAVPDEHFIDSVHLRYSGAMMIQPALRNLFEKQPEQNLQQGPDTIK